MRQTLVAAALGLVVAPSAFSTEGAAYQSPSAVFADLLLARPVPQVLFDDRAEWALLLEAENHPSVAILAEARVSIADQPITATNFNSRRMGFSSGMMLRHLPTGKDHPVKGLPAGLRAADAVFSPDTRKIAFTHTHRDAVDLYVIDVAARKATKVNKTPLNAVLFWEGIGSVPPFAWLDNDTLLYAAITQPSSAAPTMPVMPLGPDIQEHLGGPAPFVRDPKDYIRTPHDEALFRFYTRIQWVKNKDGKETPVGKPDHYSEFRVSPDGRYLLGKLLRQPFPHGKSPHELPCDLVTLGLKDGVRRVVAEWPRAEGTQIRGFYWREDVPATAYWYLHSRASGTSVQVATAPFAEAPRELVSLKGSISRPIVWGNEHTAWLNEDFQKERLTRVSRLDPAAGTLETLIERRFGLITPLRVRNTFGREALALGENGSRVMFYEPRAKTLTALDLRTKNSEALLRGEMVTRLLGLQPLTVLTQSAAEGDRTFAARTLGADTPSRELLQLKDTSPKVEGTRQVIAYKRSDGLSLSSELYLPKGYDAKRDGPLPVFMWGYPGEWSREEAAQRILPPSPPQETTIRLGHWETPPVWIADGYAVLMVAMPLVPIEGHARGNDTLTKQLCMNAEADIDAVAKLGVGDRNRVVVAGHSYGGFMAANLLAHCGQLFRAGIALSGSYNQTLNAFGFQDDERTYWQAPKVYYDASAFAFADRIKTPLLIVHGDSDEVYGTMPLHADQLFNAVKTNGGTVRYVSLPYEDHGYEGRESLLHLYWEMQRWMDRYVKGSPPTH